MPDAREPYEPLWAEGLRPPSRPPEPPREEPERAASPQVPFALGLTAVVLVATAVLAIALLLAMPSRVTVGDLPSAWGDIPMTCATARIEEPGKTLELFRCRAIRGAGPLPPGVYVSPRSGWRSDVDRRDAIDSRIRISPHSGELVGRAVYIP